MPMLSRAEATASQPDSPARLFSKSIWDNNSQESSAASLRKDLIRFLLFPLLIRKEGSVHLAWTFQESVCYRNRPEKKKQLRQSVGLCRICRVLAGLPSLLMWIWIQVFLGGGKLLLCSCCRSVANLAFSEQTAFLLHVGYLSGILIRSRVQGTPLFERPGWAEIMIRKSMEVWLLPSVSCCRADARLRAVG